MKKSSGVMTQTQDLPSIAETNDSKTKQAKGVVEALMAVACAEIKKNGNFKLAGMLNMKLKTKAASPAKKKGINPFTEEPCVFKAKPASKTVKVLALKKMKEALNWISQSLLMRNQLYRSFLFRTNCTGHIFLPFGEGCNISDTKYVTHFEVQLILG